MSLWYIHTGHQALVYVDPERNGQGIGFSIPNIEKLSHWEPKGKLEVNLRKLPRMPGSEVIQRAAAIPPGFNPNGRRR